MPNVLASMFQTQRLGEGNGHQLMANAPVGHGSHVDPEATFASVRYEAAKVTMKTRFTPKVVGIPLRIDRYATQ